MADAYIDRPPLKEGWKPQYRWILRKKSEVQALLSATAVAGLCAFALPSESRSTMLTSWYGSYFHGRTTANGETYNMYGHTAAHKTLPFGTRNCVSATKDALPFVLTIAALTLVPVSLICLTEPLVKSE